MRLIDADTLLKHKSDHETISTHLIWNAPTVDVIPVKWLKDRARLFRDCGEDFAAQIIEYEIDWWKVKNNEKNKSY